MSCPDCGGSRVTFPCGYTTSLEPMKCVACIGIAHGRNKVFLKERRPFDLCLVVERLRHLPLPNVRTNQEIAYTMSRFPRAWWDLVAAESGVVEMTGAERALVCQAVADGEVRGEIDVAARDEWRARFEAWKAAS